MVTYKQDLPPKGGFNPIEFAARGPKRMFNGFTQFGLFLGITGLAWVGWSYVKEIIRKEKLELMDARIAVEPFIYAEKDRAILTHYRRCRDEENQLMKNVKGWETGTLWGEPVYHNMRSRYIKPSLEELLTHMSPSEQSDMISDKLYR
ncbi:hypothetical protein EGW08_020271 [Elysia chlorotica]|uniref:NADH dehydrogenase [ubiquinone] 1 alpha subcomplex subunit 13 n=1 Tax=Elysia chlorotica TaxID=188477 RepID=A0A433SRT4_ELYCH|nr:hypothetical protein EGW08_020271 [Elysia chlorotica]